MKCDVINLDAKKTGAVDLDEAVFAVTVRADILARAVNWQLAKRRGGNHKVKTRSEVQGSTRKVFRQKGGGRARHGTLRVVQFRGGGVTFGPVVRSHAHGLPKKVRRLALKTALSSKQADGKLVVLDSAKLKAAKTAGLAKKLTKLGWSSALIIDGADIDANFARAAANIVGLDVLPSCGANVYDILRRDTLVLTTDAIEKLVERLK
ncbi:MAG: 50S ribosomal protein L4 [Rhodospirillales bacterium]|jgi:large subunit ribosomal protein L4|nr:50S ribosomal protein L4 [Rhodospirillales bacterium]|tara:strand:- start:444 stop:1064 length:621 start_codon:yes stop_codon:yes gene_type:complete